MTKKIISFLLAVVVIFGTAVGPGRAFAASTTPKTVYTAISKAYGKNFALKSDAKTLSAKAVGVSSKNYSSVYGKYKGNNKQKYMLFIAKAKKSADVKKIKDALNKYVKVESNSMKNYLSKTGKSLYKNAKVGSKGLYVYLMVLDTSSNTKGVNAFKKAVK